MLMTTYLYPLAERIPLSKQLNAYLDNPRTDEEIGAVVEYIRRAYSVDSAWRFPEHSDEDIVTLESLFLRFCDNFSPVDPYVAEFCKSYERDKLFDYMARMWIVARYDDEGQIEAEREFRKQRREKGEIGFTIFGEDHPILKNSRELAEYIHLLSLFAHTQQDDYAGYSFVLDSDPSQFGEDKPNPRLGLAFFTFGSFSYHYQQWAEDDNRWQFFPYIEPGLKAAVELLDCAFQKGLREKLMYIASVLKTVSEDVSDERVQLVMLVSVIELLLTHSPDFNRFNVEDSITKQFGLKAGLLIYLNDKTRDLDQIKERLRTIYKVRSNVAHGNFTAVTKYLAGLSKKEGEEEYFSDLITDLYVYIRAILNEYLKDPSFVDFLKEG
jgi:hypothetical protein